ncbi:MAG: hypothetical protein WC476_01650 [Phycisphaerae bacterium]|jgi:hypothetical protein
MTRKDRKILPYNERNWDAEPGDIMVMEDGRVWRLTESTGWGKRAAGELTPREIKKPGFKGSIQKGKLVWVKD